MENQNTLPSEPRLVGRRAEQATLKHILNSGKAEFLALYGRRRVGKTFLIRRFFENAGIPIFYVMGQSKGTLSAQLALFQKSVEDLYYDGLRLPRVRNWSEAFEILLVGLKKAIKSNPTQMRVLFIDELPWLATPKSRLLEALDHAWNTELSLLPQVKLVICGSAASWMIKNIVNAKGGLYNRLTETIHLNPFTLGESREILESNGIIYELPQVLELYLAFGGVPFYLNLVRRGESPTMAISRLCFGGGTLEMEFSTLFQALFDSSEHHEKIIRCLATKLSGYTRKEILELTGIASGGRFDSLLMELMQSGFVAPIEVGSGKKSKVNYRIIDEFVLFHLKWMETISKGPLGSASDEHHFMLQKSTPSFESWAGFAFEGVCFKHIPQIKKALGISHIRTSAKTWRKRTVPVNRAKKKISSNKNSNESQLADRGSQVDLLFDRADGVITLCEIKYTGERFLITKEYASTLTHRMQLYKSETSTSKSLFLAFITPMGLVDNEYSRQLVTNTVTASDLFT